MRSIVSLVCAAALMISTAACNGGGEEPMNVPAGTEVQSIGISQYRIIPGDGSIEAILLDAQGRRLGALTLDESDPLGNVEVEWKGERVTLVQHDGQVDAITAAGTVRVDETRRGLAAPAREAVLIANFAAPDVFEAATGEQLVVDRHAEETATDLAPGLSAQTYTCTVVGWGFTKKGALQDAAGIGAVNCCGGSGGTYTGGSLNCGYIYCDATANYTCPGD